jgi:acyl-CoA synthetase (AMP-forming)/AMP-acid ligase II
LETAIDAPDAAGVGTIRVRGPTMMLGYHDDPDLTAAVLRDGWLETPDLGRLDGDGTLWVVGRRDDAIVTGGENVDPAEVEAALGAHPSVSDACVVGVPHAEWGQAVTAVVALRQGARARPDELLASLRSRLAPFKIPKALHVWKEVPRTPNGKLQRARVRERLGSDTVPM